MITFRYKDKGTAIHKVNAFCKLAWVVSILVLSLIFNNPIYLLLLFLSTLPIIIAARVWREWASLMKFAFYLCLAIIIIMPWLVIMALTFCGRLRSGFR